jgi:hypothetical protein
MGDEPQLDWSAADVNDGTLSVPITGEFDDDWEQTFARTLALLSSRGTWGAVSFKEATVAVEEVAEGSEENVRFALDGAVQEANAHHVDQDGASEETPGEDDDEPAGDDTDRRMTDRFRDTPD